MGVTSGMSGVLVAVAVLRTSLTRCQADIRGIFDHLHNATQREREFLFEYGALKQQVDHLQKEIDELKRR